MRVMDRFVIALAALLALAFGVAALSLAAGWNGVLWAVDVIMADRGAARLESALTGLLAAAVGVYLLALAGQRETEPGNIALPGELGDVSVSLRAVESLVLQAASSIRGVREATTRLGQEEGRLTVDLSVLVTSERPVPELAAEVQQRVTRHVQDVVGVPVGRVSVAVRNIASGHKARVE